MAIQTGDIIAALDVKARVETVFTEMQNNLKNIYKSGGAKWVETVFASNTGELAAAYKSQIDLKLKGSDMADVSQSAPALHVVNDDVVSQFSTALNNYEVAAGKLIAVGGLVRSMISCFTAATSLRMAIYSILDVDQDVLPFKTYRTLTYFKTGIYPPKGNWNNGYVALLSSNLTSYEKYKTFFMTNRSCTDENATIFELGSEPLQDAYKITTYSPNNAVSYGQINLSTVNGYYSNLSGKQDGWIPSSVDTLGSLVPSITNFHDTTPPSNVELKIGKHIRANSVNRLFGSLQHLNSTIASAYYGTYSNFDADNISHVRYIIDKECLLNKDDHISVDMMAVNGRTFKLKKWQDIFTETSVTPTSAHITPADFNMEKVLFREGTNDPFDYWGVFKNPNAQIRINPSPITKMYPNEYVAVDSKYIDIWLVPLYKAKPWPDPDPDPDPDSRHMLSWGHWNCDNKKLDIDEYNRQLKSNDNGTPIWSRYVKRISKGEFRNIGDDETEFIPGTKSGMLTNVPGNGDDFVNTFKKWPAGKHNAVCSKWANMTISAEGDFKWFALTCLSCSVNETTTSHRGFAVLLVDRNRINWSDNMVYDNLTYVPEVYDHVPNGCKRSGYSITRQQVRADGVYLINRYLCHISLNDKYHPDYGTDDNKGGDYSKLFWASDRDVLPYHGRINTFSAILDSNNKIVGMDANTKWDNVALCDNWGKPMFFKTTQSGTKSIVNMAVYLVRVNESKEVGSDQSWGEGICGFFVGNYDTEADLPTGTLGSFPSQMKTKNKQEKWVNASVWRV